MADVFISYSRADGEYVRCLQSELHRRGKDVWVDVEGIRDAELFPLALRRAIEGSAAFVFVISPESVHSAFCEQEVSHASELNKRIVPLALRDVPDEEIPDEIRFRNWIPAADRESVERLLAALEIDLEWERQHARLTVKALEWDQAGRDRSFLVRGADLAAAERWLAAGAGRDPGPSALEQAYLLAARTAAHQRQRGVAGASLAVAAISIGLLIFALVSRGEAVSERVSARAQALAAQSQAELPNDPEISLILGMRAVKAKATPESRFALRAALDASPLELGLPSVNVSPQCSQNLGGGLIAAYSPDGRQIAEAVCSGQVRLLDAASGRLERSVSAGRGAAGVAYSPDGASLAVATGPGVTLLDPHTGKVLRRLGEVHSPRPAQTLAVAFSPNGRMLAATSPAGLTVWTLPDGRPRALALTPAQGPSLAFSPDGRHLYTGGMDALVRVYDVASGRQLREIDPFPRSHGQSWPLVVAVSHDGGRLAIGYPGGVNGSGVVSIYSTRSWRKEFDVMSLPEVEIQSLAFSPDDTRLAVGAYDGTAGVWSLIAREQLAAYDGPTASVNSVSFSPDGRSVLTASSDGIARVWRALGVERSFLSVNGNINFMALRGATLSVIEEGSAIGDRVAQWRLPSGQPVDTHTLLPTANDGFADISADGRYAFVARFPHPVSPNSAPLPAALTIVDAATGRVVRRLGSTTFDPEGAPMFSPNDSKLILNETPAAKAIPGPGGLGTGLTGHTRLEVRTLATGHAVTLNPAEPCGPAVGVRWAFSGDGRRVAQESFCGIVEVWEVDTGRLIRTVNQNAETSAVALNYDGSRLLVASWDSRATIYSVATGRALVNFIGHTRGIGDAVLSPDGTRVVTAGLDHTVRVWDARTGQNLRVLTFTDDQYEVAYSTDDSEFAVAENTPIFGVPNLVRVFNTCPACQNAGQLLRLATPHATNNTTRLEQAVLAGS